VQQEVTAEREAEERELELMRQEGEAEEMAAE
jgi:DNA-directed RNA polymerase subunit beta'